MRRLLITGFGPFPRVPHNPSARLARDVAADPRWRRLEVTVEALVLETRYAAIETHLLPKIREFRPHAILMLGVAARRRHVGIETRAVNRASRLMPDAGGRMAAQLAYRPGAAHVLRSRAPAGAMMRAMRSCGVNAKLSRDAGRYLCNAAYFDVLAQAPEATRARTAFIHVPMPDKREKPRRSGRQAGGFIGRAEPARPSAPARKMLVAAIAKAAWTLAMRARCPSA